MAKSGLLKPVSISYDSHAVDFGSDKITFTYSARDEEGVSLEAFITELHLPLRHDRPLTAAEDLVVLCFGVCHATYVWLPFAKSAPLLEVRAGHLTSDQLAYLQQQLQGALAEYFYVADMDIAGRVQLTCCCPPAGKGAAAAAAAAHSGTPVPAQTQPSSGGERQGARPRVIVPFGGGKDSTTLVELLHRMGCDVQWAYYGEWVGSWGDYTKFEELARASPCASVLKAEQRLPCADRLKELNLLPDVAFMDYIAYVSFYTLTAALFALQHGYDHICVGNEQSANAINLVHPRFGYAINHQYEKAFVSEQATHAFLRDHVSPQLWYFSGLQHMSELEIAQRFVATCTDKYLHLIISCNWATDDNWCGQCEKCVFVYTMFAAFLQPTALLHTVWRQVPGKPLLDAAPGVTCLDDHSTATLPPAASTSTHSACACNYTAVAAALRGRGSGPATWEAAGGPPSLVPHLAGCADMFASAAHLPVFEQLMGLSGHKPLECVGTPEEVLAALYLASQTHYQAPAAASDGSNRGNFEGGDGAAPAGAAAAAAVVACSSDGGEAEAGSGAAASKPPCPLLIAKHWALIRGQGRAEWERIQGDMRDADRGTLHVPTLYPPWYQLGSVAPSGSCAQQPGAQP